MQNGILTFHKCIIPNNPFYRADGLLGDAHDAANVAVFQAHLEEDEKEGVVGGHGSVFLLDAAERGEVGSLTVVDEA